MASGNGARTVQHASFILLAEFDIDQGSVLSHQYPYPTGVDEQLLAELMIPDGVHDHSEDWTVFFLNQTPGNTIASIFTPGEGDEGHDDKSDLLHVLNLVRTKHDKTVRRGAIVKALAICTHHPYIQIFKPILLMALENYYSDPSVECLVRLFDSINAMDMSLSPTLTRDEKFISRVSERKDLFSEKFILATTGKAQDPRAPSTKSHKKTPSTDSGSQFSITTGTRKLSLSATQSTSGHGHDRTPSISTSKQPSTRSRSPSVSLNSVSEGDEGQRGSVAGSAIWVGENDSFDATARNAIQGNQSSSGSDPSLRPRRVSMDQTSISSSLSQGTQAMTTEGTKSSSDGHRPSSQPHHHHHHRRPVDTHFFDTAVQYNNVKLPIKIPVTSFPEEVGDYSLIQLIQTFTSPTAVVSGPAHPHLHTNGALTPPLIILFNALITQKRIIFMGYGQPAGKVANYVLAACALGSGCGCYLRGFIERAFPYTNLVNKSVMESVPGYIAGVTNPIYESLPIWDILCHIDTGKIIVHKDIAPVQPAMSSFPAPPTLNIKSGQVTSVGDDESRASVQMTAAMMVGGGALGATGVKSEQAGKSDNYDLGFVEELVNGVSQHYGETMIRARVAEYVNRFVRIAAAYEDSVLGSTSIGFPMQSFSETGVSTTMIGMGIPQGLGGSLGSGMVFVDDLSKAREMTSNASRIEGWRSTKNYEYWQHDFQNWLEHRPVKGMDLQHQIGRLRYGKNMPDGEVELIMRSMHACVRTYDQIVELLSHLPPQHGGLIPVTFGIFHTSRTIRETTVDLVDVIRTQPIGEKFVVNLNQFHRLAYLQILETRKRQEAEKAAQQEQMTSQLHQQAQIAQQLYAAASVDSIPQTGSLRESRSAASHKSKRETLTQIFGPNGGVSNGVSTPSLSRAGSMHRNVSGPTVL
ncbi:hypothetical protein FRC04_002832 [Tulasnella sp. 424]|nr:hypothetical protein FRC04_002832 [Tulasnella sp. 424]KAG8963780.1 hypothetical protein FRC05_004526 [Tulasnella sp. 425]